MVASAIRFNNFIDRQFVCLDRRRRPFDARQARLYAGLSLGHFGERLLPRDPIAANRCAHHCEIRLPIHHRKPGDNHSRALRKRCGGKILRLGLDNRRRRPKRQE